MYGFKERNVYVKVCVSGCKGMYARGSVTGVTESLRLLSSVMSCVRSSCSPVTVIKDSVDVGCLYLGLGGGWYGDCIGGQSSRGNA